MKLAVPTNDQKGLRDRVAQTFSRAPTFTLITVEDGAVKNTEVIKNKAESMEQGAGPLATRTLKEHGVDVLLCGDIGPGASNILETIGIEFCRVEVGEKVKRAVEYWLNL